jgi:hypothetical protein
MQIKEIIHPERRKRKKCGIVLHYNDIEYPSNSKFKRLILSIVWDNCEPALTIVSDSPEENLEVLKLVDLAYLGGMQGWLDYELASAPSVKEYNDWKNDWVYGKFGIRLRDLAKI